MACKCDTIRNFPFWFFNGSLVMGRGKALSKNERRQIAKSLGNTINQDQRLLKSSKGP